MTRWVPMIALLAGCSTTPEPLPVPPIQPTPVLCTVPAKLTEPEEQPARPTGSYSQKDVADYIKRLHHWGSQGWLQLQSIDRWSSDCVHRERLRTGQPAG